MNGQIIEVASMGDIPEFKPVEIEKAGDGGDKSEALVNRIEIEPIANEGENPLAGVKNAMMENDIMPALSSEDLADTVGKTAEALNGKTISIPGDGGLSSASAVSTILKASGAEGIEQTMNIRVLHDQMLKAGWKEVPYKNGEPINPGEVAFTGMNRNGRNVGIGGRDGIVYSHSMRQGGLIGYPSESWRSRFQTKMSPPEKRE